MRREVGIPGILEGVSGIWQGGKRRVLVVVGLIMSQACTAGPRERSPSTFYRANLRREGSQMVSRKFTNRGSFLMGSGGGGVCRQRMLA